MGRPLRVAILSDFTRIPYANGAAFQTRFLYQELRRAGHEVTIIGPEDPDALPGELAPGTISLPSLPLRAYPGLRIPLPLAPWIFDVRRWEFDVCFAQTTTLLLEFGLWLRAVKGIPLICVNTTHLVAAYRVLLPESLSANEALQAGILFALTRRFEKLFAGIYNHSEGLVVLSEGLRSYWRKRGVVAPIQVIPRAVPPEVFDRPRGPDPFARLGSVSPPGSGGRLICAGRLTREKAQDRLIRIFAQYVAPRVPHATLTVVGDGPDMAAYRRVADELGMAHRVRFLGEVSWDAMPDIYRYADVFLHASLSETYGNVLAEASWCGLPAVAFEDGMGVSFQTQDGQNAALVSPGSDVPGRLAADAAFGNAVVSLVKDPQARARMGSAAARAARARGSPAAVMTLIARAFGEALDRVSASGVQPAPIRPKAMQWLTTLRHAQAWTLYNGLLCLGGYLRPHRVRRGGNLQPQMGA